MKSLKTFILTDQDDKCMDMNPPQEDSDQEAIRIIRQVTGLELPEHIAELPTAKRNAMLAAIKRENVPERQIARLTGIGRMIVRKAE